MHDDSRLVWYIEQGKDFTKSCPPVQAPVSVSRSEGQSKVLRLSNLPSRQLAPRRSRMWHCDGQPNRLSVLLDCIKNQTHQCQVHLLSQMAIEPFSQRNRVWIS